MGAGRIFGRDNKSRLLEEPAFAVDLLASSVRLMDNSLRIVEELAPVAAVFALTPASRTVRLIDYPMMLASLAPKEFI